eukprot:3657999-Pleurochrysis_carterae.AAC.1
MAVPPRRSWPLLHGNFRRRCRLLSRHPRPRQQQPRRAARPLDQADRVIAAEPSTMPPTTRHLAEIQLNSLLALSQLRSTTRTTSCLRRIKAFDAARELGRTEATGVLIRHALPRSVPRSARWVGAFFQCSSHLMSFSHFVETVRGTRIDARTPAGRGAHALAFAHAHRCWFEQFERVSLSQHKSYYPAHRAQCVAPLHILELGDLWDYSVSSQESFHAEVGRVAV